MPESGKRVVPGRVLHLDEARARRVYKKTAIEITSIEFVPISRPPRLPVSGSLDGGAGSTGMRCRPDAEPLCPSPAMRMRTVMARTQEALPCPERPVHPDDEHVNAPKSSNRRRPAAQRPFFTPEQIHDLVVRSRRAQGLPLTITDASVLDLVARIFGPPRPAKRVGVVRDLACGHPGEDECRPSRLAS